MAKGGVNISNKFLMLSFSSSLFKERCSNEANVSHVKAYYSIGELHRWIENKNTYKVHDNSE